MSPCNAHSSQLYFRLLLFRSLRYAFHYKSRPLLLHSPTHAGFLLVRLSHRVRPDRTPDPQRRIVHFFLKLGVSTTYIYMKKRKGKRRFRLNRSFAHTAIFHISVQFCSSSFCCVSCVPSCARFYWSTSPIYNLPIPSGGRCSLTKRNVSPPYPYIVDVIAHF